MKEKVISNKENGKESSTIMKTKIKTKNTERIGKIHRCLYAV